MPYNYYIIRTGSFANDANKKLLYSLFSVTLCLDDYFSNRSLDCTKIMCGSSFVWTIIEICLNVSRTRVIKPMHLTIGSHKYRLSKYTGILLQGIQEGGVVTTFGLYFGDRLSNVNYFIMLQIFTAYIAYTVHTKRRSAKNACIASRRQINTWTSLGLMGAVTIFNCINMYRSSDAVRQLKMLAVMCYVSGIWTSLSSMRNSRRVEVVAENSTGRIVLPYHYWSTFGVLSYDVFVEIGFAYLTFYAWFVQPSDDQ